MKRAALAACVSVLFAPIGAQAAVGDVRVLEPTSDWNLDFGVERCSLIREFSDGTDKARLQIDAFGPTRRGYRVMISGSVVPFSDAAPMAEFRVRYSPDTTERERFTVLAGKFGEDNAVSFRQGFLPPAPAGAASSPPQMAPGANPTGSEFEGSVRHMTVEFRNQESFRLETGSMAAPFAAMHRCVDSLIASWGIDPAVHRALSRPVRVAELPDGERRLDPEAWSDHPGYTERRLRAMAQAVLSAGELIPVRLMIDAAGKQTACVVQVAVASEARRLGVCESFKDYRFGAALDAAGQPVASFTQFETR